MSREKLKPWTPTQEFVGRIVLRIMSALNTWVFQLSGGRIGNRFPGGAPILLLTTFGRKTGRPRIAPLLYLRDGEKIAIVASQAGMSKHPLWYLNLEANRDCEVQIGDETSKMEARRASEEEKAALWPRLVQMYKDYEDYQSRTERNIPVMILSRR